MVVGQEQIVLLAQTGNVAEAIPEAAPIEAANLPEPVRQIAYMALLGIALLGMLMIVGTLLGGHWVRRLGNTVRRRSLPDDVMIPRPTSSASHLSSSTSKPGTPNDGETLGGSDTKVM